jgi:hypothetical protein
MRRRSAPVAERTPPPSSILDQALRRPGCANSPDCVLPYIHIHDIVCHMKTTLNIDDTVMAELKREAAQQGRTMSELVETALRLMLRAQRKPAKLLPLPTFKSGTLVDVSDREALYQAMEGR